MLQPGEGKLHNESFAYTRTSHEMTHTYPELSH